MARYKAPPLPKEPARVAVSHRFVYTSAVGPLGPVHRLAVFADGSSAGRTDCGNWPSRDDAPSDLPDNRCPVCFRIAPRPNERTRT